MYFLQILYLYLPAFVANAAPVVFARVPVMRRWNQPIDAQLLGKNKTMRGFFFSPLVAGFVGILQFALNFLPQVSRFSLIHPSLLGALFVGMLLGLGAMLGDVLKSYFKRRIKIAPGKAWPVIDGIDYMVGALLLFAPYYVPTIDGMLFLLFVGPLASLLANTVSYCVGWKKVWY